MSNRKRYTLVHELLTATPPPPKTAGTPVYHLDQYSLRRSTTLVSVQLVGIRGHEKRTETITFPLLQDVPDAELVRAAVWFSPHKWTLSSDINFSQFQNTFASPLDAQLLTALTHTQKTHATGTHSQPQPPLHNQPTLRDASFNQQHIQPPYPQPGQFQPPHVHNPQQRTGARNRKPGVWHWYKTRTRGAQFLLVCAAIIAILLFYALANAAVGNGNTTTPQATSTPSQQAVVTGDMLTPLPTPTQPAPTPTPTPQPTIAPTQAVQPTQPPTPTPPACRAVNGNPWCYNFSPGNLIYNPPSNFCDYFGCIASFGNGSGYVVECQDTLYSSSGGMQGACSHHGGVMRPLYAH
jgi:hypothetical protein